MNANCYPCTTTSPKILGFEVSDEHTPGMVIYRHPIFGNFRVIMQNGDPWFVAADISRALGYRNGPDMIRMLDDDEKGTHLVRTPGGEQGMSILSEAGLYSAILRSQREESKVFKRWITHDVVPSIRRHGMYATPQTVEAMLADPDTAITLLQTLKRERILRTALEAQAAIDRPKVAFADAVDASQTSILLGDFAKILHQNGIDIGPRRLFEWMRERGYLMKFGSSCNMPTQRSMEMKLFEIKERTINNPDGSIRITKTPKLTGKGQIYFVNLFKKATEAEVWQG